MTQRGTSRTAVLGALAAIVAVTAVAAATCTGSKSGPPSGTLASSCPDGAVAGDGAAGTAGDPVAAAAQQAVQNGRQIFRFDTFGSEAFWGDTLKLHQAIAGSANGGVGAGLSPKAALAAGLKVDAEAVPAALAEQIKAGQVNLDDPASTLALLQINAVVGLTASFNTDKTIRTIGIQCALCHSTVDDSFAPGIGKRLDGWPNRDLNVGAIIAMAPDLTPFTQLLQVDAPTVRQVVLAWGPGKFDAELLLDGKGTRPDGKTSATLLPAAFGLAGVSLHTWTGWGSVPHWNAFVANLDMMGTGTFFDPRLDDATKFPIAARVRAGHVRKTPDLITSKLGDLHIYQLALRAPSPPAASFDAQAASRGQALFAGKARCAECHVPPIFTEPGWPMHTAAEIGIDDFQAQRSPDGRYRTTPLAGLFTRTKGGFYHDGRFATLADVVAHYDAVLALGLSDAEKGDLVQYLKSL
jgi:hypothetical protein